jgi:hypothetical protein
MRCLVLQVVGMQLAKHVLNNKGKLIAGISNVTLVEDDLRVREARRARARTCSATPKASLQRLLAPAVLPQAAFVVCQGTRAQLRVASDEVQRQIKIITSTRKKRDCLELYEALRKVQQVQDLPAALRWVAAGHTHAPGQPAQATVLSVCRHGSKHAGACTRRATMQRASCCVLTASRRWMSSGNSRCVRGAP